jgi:hypothetical protein
MRAFLTIYQKITGEELAIDAYQKIDYIFSICKSLLISKNRETITKNDIGLQFDDFWSHKICIN